MKEDKKLPTPYQNYIYKSRYARYLWDEKRREEWPETVDRYINFFKEKYPKACNYNELREAIINLEVMPSMRCLMTAGPALEKDNVAGYNCAYVAVDSQRVFDEILYILMCGTGVGFSVERHYVDTLPIIAEEFHGTETIIRVADSKRGWASALRQLIGMLYGGNIPEWDLSKLRPAGSPLRTFGGRSSGPEPLEDLFNYCVRLFRAAAGRRLTSLECHDLICKIAEVVICGGVRRSALISLSNLTDERMRHAKTGEWHLTSPHRRFANNSVSYVSTPDTAIFLKEWTSLYESKSGERGIFSRSAAKASVPDRRDGDWEFGTNPCSEIILRSRQFCNLSEVVVRAEDRTNELLRKVRLAATLGTLQSTLTDFKYLGRGWRNNTEEERLLGVSLTGIMDNPLLSDNPSPRLLNQLKEEAIKTNEKVAKKLGIPNSTSITCVKPSGTVSQLVNSSSGIHPRYSKYYIRRVRADARDPMCNALINAGVPYEQDIFSTDHLVFSFPIKSPLNSICVADVGAIAQLEHWKVFNEKYCEHKPSVSIYVQEDEWIEVAAWVHKNFEFMSGVSFFPHSDHVYRQAPYESISKKEYNKLIKDFPTEIDFEIEEENDTTTASQELACAGGECEL